MTEVKVKVKRDEKKPREGKTTSQTERSRGSFSACPSPTTQQPGSPRFPPPPPYMWVGRDEKLGATTCGSKPSLRSSSSGPPSPPIPQTMILPRVLDAA